MESIDLTRFLSQEQQQQAALYKEILQPKFVRKPLVEHLGDALFKMIVFLELKAKVHVPVSFYVLAEKMHERSRKLEDLCVSYVKQYPIREDEYLRNHADSIAVCHPTIGRYFDVLKKANNSFPESISDRIKMAYQRPYDFRALLKALGPAVRNYGSSHLLLEADEELAIACEAYARKNNIREDEYITEIETLMKYVDKNDFPDLQLNFERLKKANEKFLKGKEKIIKMAQEDPWYFKKYLENLTQVKSQFAAIISPRLPELYGKKYSEQAEGVRQWRKSLDRDSSTQTAPSGNVEISNIQP